MSIKTRLDKLFKTAEVVSPGRLILCDETEDAPGAQPGYYAVSIDGQWQPGFYTEPELQAEFNITQTDKVIFIVYAPYNPEDGRL